MTLLRNRCHCRLRVANLRGREWRTGRGFAVRRWFSVVNRWRRSSVVRKRPRHSYCCLRKQQGLIGDRTKCDGLDDASALGGLQTARRGFVIRTDCRQSCGEANWLTAAAVEAPGDETCPSNRRYGHLPLATFHGVVRHAGPTTLAGWPFALQNAQAVRCTTERRIHPGASGLQALLRLQERGDKQMAVISRVGS